MQLLRALLYFNLPYESIVKDQLVPEKCFDNSIDSVEKQDIGDLIEVFENYGDTITPSVILMKVDHGFDEDTSAVKSYIIGGYASHGWRVSVGMGNGGGSGSGNGIGGTSCFLFNLTLNLRFNAREGLDYY